jgi:hypothetical protein
MIHLAKVIPRFSKEDIARIQAGWQLSYNGSWVPPPYKAATVKLEKYGYYATGVQSVDGRFISEPKADGGVKDLVYDSHGDKTIIHYRFYPPRPEGLHQQSYQSIKCKSINSRDVIYQSYWRLTLIESGIIERINNNG